MSRPPADPARWTRPASEHYDAEVAFATLAPVRLIRFGATIRGALLAGFATLFGLWLLSGYELIRSLAEVETRVAAVHESFVRGERTLSTVRTNVLLGSIYLRDSLIDSGALTRDYYRDELVQIRDEISKRLPIYLLEVELPIERQQWADLQIKLNQYWNTLELAFDPDRPRGSVQTAALIRRQVVPARESVLQIVDRLSALQRMSQQRHQVETSVLYGEVRNRFVTIAAASMVVGLIVAVVAFWHAGRLERQINRQRLAETRNRHDLERLSARLVDAQEDERRHLARELHDEVGQALTAIKMDIGVALRTSDARARAALEEARTLAETTLQSVRDMSQLLHPSMLDDFGLPETLTAFLRSFSKRTGIRAQLTAERLDGRLPADVEVCVYRIVQEALTNVARHSGARGCDVMVLRQPGQLRLVVQDDGRGMGGTSTTSDVRRGLGLIGMRERAQALSGRFEIESRPGRGTRVVVTLPVPEERAAEAQPEPVAV